MNYHLDVLNEKNRFIFELFIETEPGPVVGNNNFLDFICPMRFLAS